MTTTAGLPDVTEEPTSLPGIMAWAALFNLVVGTLLTIVTIGVTALATFGYGIATVSNITGGDLGAAPTFTDFVDELAMSVATSAVTTSVVLALLRRGGSFASWSATGQAATAAAPAGLVGLTLLLHLNGLLPIG